MDFDFTLEELTDAFTYLDNLRESGATNMFGAAPYLQDEFLMEKREARTVLTGWMDTFDGESTVESRVDNFVKRMTT